MCKKDAVKCAISIMHLVLERVYQSSEPINSNSWILEHYDHNKVKNGFGSDFWDEYIRYIKDMKCKNITPKTEKEFASIFGLLRVPPVSAKSDHGTRYLDRLTELCKRNGCSSISGMIRGSYSKRLLAKIEIFLRDADKDELNEYSAMNIINFLETTNPDIYSLDIPSKWLTDHLKTLSKEKFYEIYKKTVELLTFPNKKNFSLFDIDVDISVANSIIDYYIKDFSKSSGPILMDRGLPETGQGEHMEYARTNKKITYVGLDSCLGLTLQGKIGVHLIIPWEPEQMIVYAKRIDMIRSLCNDGEIIKIGCKSENEAVCHVLDIPKHFDIVCYPESGNVFSKATNDYSNVNIKDNDIDNGSYNKSLKWLYKKVVEWHEYEEVIGSNGTVTI